jgi:hypothetical protein
MARTAQERWQETCHHHRFASDPSISVLLLNMSRYGADVAGYFLLRVDTSDAAIHLPDVCFMG